MLLPLKRYIFYSLHSHPTDPILRQSFVTWLLLKDKQNNTNLKKMKQSLDYRLESIYQMNQDDNANNITKFHKKHALMYNIEEPNAWIGYIGEEWRKKKETKWIKHLEKLLMR
jgi:hypothetical protein